MVVVHEVVSFGLEDLKTINNFLSLIVSSIKNCYFHYLLDTLSSGSESLEDFDNGSTLLHGDNTHLILLVDPDEEVLGVIVEDT